MSETPYMGQDTDAVLGREFLTWLWYQSDTSPDTFTTDKGEPFSVVMEQRIVVQGGEGETLETASVSGSLSPLREARLGLATGKKVTRALIRIEKDEMSWQCTLKAEDFSLNSLRTPKVERDDDADEEALLLEKIYLLETCLAIIDSLYARFLRLRLSNDAWQAEATLMQQWFVRNDSV